MRNATATFDDDFGSTGAPRRANARPRSASAGAKKKSAKRGRFSMNGVARYAAIGMAATMALGIVVNALVLQKGHHPAPLFAKAAAPSPPPAAAAKPAVAMAVRAAASEPAPLADPAPTKSHKAAVHDADPAPAGDAIGRLLAGDAPAAASRSGGSAVRTSEARAPDARTVTGAQRALTKLGFKVPATGTAGPVTRKAIEAFEKDHHLPVHGTLDRRLVKLLSTQSGVKID